MQYNTETLRLLHYLILFYLITIVCFNCAQKGAWCFWGITLHFVGYSWFHCQPIISALYGRGSPNGGKRYCTYLKLDPQSPTKFYQCAYDLCLHASLLTCNFDLNLKLIWISLNYYKDLWPIRGYFIYVSSDILTFSTLFTPICMLTFYILWILKVSVFYYSFKTICSIMLNMVYQKRRFFEKINFINYFLFLSRWCFYRRCGHRYETRGWVSNGALWTKRLCWIGYHEVHFRW